MNLVFMDYDFKQSFLFVPIIIQCMNVIENHNTLGN